MAYRWNGVVCDTFEELQRLQGSARTSSAAVKETRKQLKVQESTKCKSGNRNCGDWRCNYCGADS